MTFNARDFFTRFAIALNERDIASLAEMVHPDFVGDSPQSGERVRGFEAFAAELMSYPGEQPPQADVPQAQLVGGDERWAITPNYTVVPLASPNVYTALLRTRYPDGSHWHVVTIAELRDGKVYRAESYFAPEMEPPEWRRPYAEIVPRE